MNYTLFIVIFLFNAIYIAPTDDDALLLVKLVFYIDVLLQSYKKIQPISWDTLFSTIKFYRIILLDSYALSTAA